MKETEGEYEEEEEEEDDDSSGDATRAPRRAFARRLDDVNEDDHGNNDKNTKIPICFIRVYPTLSISFN